MVRENEIKFVVVCRGVHSSGWLRMPAWNVGGAGIAVRIVVEEFLGPKCKSNWRATVGHVNDVGTQYASTANFKTAKAAKQAAAELAQAMGLQAWSC
jgi:hypothetical protein